MFFTTACIQAHQIKFQPSAFPCPVITPSGSDVLPTFPDMQEKSVRSYATDRVLPVSSCCGKTAAVLDHGHGLSFLPDLSSLSLDDLELLY